MPAPGCEMIVIDSHRWAERLAAIRTARKHYFGARPLARRHHACEHIDVVIGRPAGVIDCQETLPIESSGVDAAKAQCAPEIDRDNLIKTRGNSSVLRVAGTKTPKTTAGRLLAADKKVAIRI